MTIFDKAKDLAQSVADNVVEAGSAILKGVEELAGSLGDQSKDAAEAAADATTDAGEQVLDAASDAVDGATQTVVDAAQTLIAPEASDKTS